MSATLLVGSALGLLIAALYGHLGIQQARAGGLARGAFALFWLGIGAHAALESAWALSMLISPPPLAIGVTVLMLKILTAVAAFGGLTTYLLLVYGGDDRIVPYTAATYVAVYGFVAYDYLSRVPIGQETRTWYAGLQYLHPEGLLHEIVALVLFLPPFLAAIGYALLLRLSRSPQQRRRIIATSVGFAIFFGGFLLGWVHERWVWWGLIERLLAIGTSLAILWTLRSATVARDPAAPRAEAEGVQLRT